MDTSDIGSATTILLQVVCRLFLACLVHLYIIRVYTVYLLVDMQTQMSPNVLFPKFNETYILVKRGIFYCRHLVFQETSA